MSEHPTPDAVLADRVTFWRDIHSTTIALYTARGADTGANLELPEQQAHDAMVVLHALAHAWLETLGVPSYPNCPAGQGIDVLFDQGFVVELWANK